MPYIPQDQRRILDPRIEALAQFMENPGVFNYAVTKLALALIENLPEYNYVTLNAVIGALECAKLEMYRRRIAPYEMRKMHENGDVY